jgi:hypothetical protein
MEAWSRRRWKEVLLAFIVVVLVVFLILSLLPSGGPLSRFSWTYYRYLGTHFIGNIKLGTLSWVAGPFISPSKSILIYSPVLFLLPWAVRKAWRKVPSWSLSAISFPIFLAIAQALFYGERWSGSFGWGLRFMLPALPGLFGFLAFYLDDLPKTSRRLWIFIVLVGLGVLIQVSGSVTDWVIPYRDLQEIGVNPFDPNSAWSLRSLVIPLQLNSLLNFQNWRIAWLRTSVVDTRAFILPAVLVFSTTVAYLLSKKAAGKIFSTTHFGLIFWILACLCLPLVLPLGFLKSDPYWGMDVSTYRQGRKHVGRMIGEEDIILVDGYGTPLWKVMMNQWDHPNPWISLPYEILPPDTGSEPSELDFDLSSKYFPNGEDSQGAIWYIGSELIPDFISRDELSWLEQNYLECGQWEFPGEVYVDVRLFDRNTCE